MENSRGKVEIQIELYDELKNKIYNLELEKEELKNELFSYGYMIGFYQTYSGLLSQLGNVDRDIKGQIEILFNNIKRDNIYIIIDEKDKNHIPIKVLKQVNKPLKINK